MRAILKSILTALALIAGALLCVIYDLPQIHTQFILLLIVLIIAFMFDNNYPPIA